MNKSLWILLCLLPLAGCSPVHTENSEPKQEEFRTAGALLSPFTYLRKLSFHIRGQTPSRTEYDELSKAIAANDTENFFHEKINQLLISNEHIDKMAFRLEELFFLSPSGVAFNSPLQDPSLEAGTRPVDYSIHNSLNNLFREIATRNLSWDTLLTGRTYKAFPFIDPVSSTMSDAMFLTSVAQVPQNIPAPVDVAFDIDDGRIAGSLTTSRFFNRYGNTALNKNRRRAAAVFRIFLCDDMKAVVVDEKGNQDGILDRVFPGAVAGPGSGTPVLPDRHGSDPACLKCHYKLDPMGLTFRNSGLVLSPLASPGALVFTRADGGAVNEPGHGIGEVAQAITRKDEYVRCQVQHFWGWFIGSDTILEESTMSELTAKFNSLDRKTNDFIAYLVSRPEFGSFESRTSAQQMAFEVKAVLNNCNGCHAVNNVPSFTNWPIGGSAGSHAKWLDLIRQDLSLDGSGRARKMPPATSVWQPDAGQVDLLKRWFAAGSPGLEHGGGHDAH